MVGIPRAKETAAEEPRTVEEGEAKTRTQAGRKCSTGMSPVERDAVVWKTLVMLDTRGGQSCGHLKALSSSALRDQAVVTACGHGLLSQSFKAWRLESNRTRLQWIERRKRGLCGQPS